MIIKIGGAWRRSTSYDAQFQIIPIGKKIWLVKDHLALKARYYNKSIFIKIELKQKQSICLRILPAMVFKQNLS